MISLYLVIYDVIAVNAAYFLGLWFRFDCTYSAIPGEYLSAYLKFTPWYTVFSVFVFWMLRLYNSVWRFASYSDYISVSGSWDHPCHTADANVLLLIWNHHPVLPDRRDPFFLSVYPSGEDTETERRGRAAASYHADRCRPGRADYSP